ncbi:MAG: DMT family transporter [Bacteroidia bacterium]|nr:DMT family transporter [Bacteroidia bacterium]
MRQETKNFILLHIGLLFISTSGVLGRSISLDVPVTIAWRAVIGFACIFLLFIFQKKYLWIARKHNKLAFLSAVFMAGHWLTYFYALYYSNIAISMIAIFTYPMMTVLLEPIFLKTPFHLQIFITALVMTAGIAFLVPEYNFENSYTIGMLFGLASALCYTFRNLIMKSLIDHYDGTKLMLHQLFWAMVILAPIFLFYQDINPGKEWPLILALGIMTTAIGHTLFVQSFRKYSVSMASIISMIQPIYGIGLGVIILSEIPDWKTSIGGVIILTGLAIQNHLFKKSQVYHEESKS